METLDANLDLMMINYNTSILNYLPEDLRNALYEEANKCLTDTKSAKLPDRCTTRDTLMRLIDNHRLNNKPVADLIKGPLTLTFHWHPEMKMMIYIFGEFHESNTDCIRLHRKKYINGKIVPVKSMFIEDYMKDLILNTDSYIDFYIEEKAHFGYDQDFSDYTDNKRITIMINRFRECISNVRTRNTNQNCRLSRSHYFDIRQGVVNGNFDIVSQINFALCMLFDKYKFNSENNDNPKRNFVKDFTEIYENKLFEVFIDKIKSEEEDKEFAAYLQEELINKYIFLNDKIDRSTMKQSIRTFILDEIKVTALTLKEIIQTNLENLFDEFELFTITDDKLVVKKNRPNFTRSGKMIKVDHFDKFVKCVSRFHQALINLNSIIADAYLLSRIFKTFDTKTTHPVKKRNFDEPENPHNIIIYAGNAHADRCRKFLEDVASFKRLEENTVENPIRAKNCLDMTGITQPLFSYTPKADHAYYDTQYKPIFNVYDVLNFYAQH
jgi:hypothetical protein